MKTMKTATVTAMALWTLALTATATSRDVAWMGNVDLSALNRVKIVEKAGDYFLEVELTLRNRGAETLKLRNGVFHMVLEAREPAPEAEETTEATPARAKGQKPEPKVERIEIGSAAINEIELPGTNGKKQPGTATKVVTVYLGPTNDEETTAKAMRLLNAVGLPTNAITVGFQGVAEIGLKVPHGWVFELGKSYELDLQFTPTIQRRVPFI